MKENYYDWKIGDKINLGGDSEISVIFSVSKDHIVYKLDNYITAGWSHTLENSEPLGYGLAIYNELCSHINKNMGPIAISISDNLGIALSQHFNSASNTQSITKESVENIFASVKMTLHNFLEKMDQIIASSKNYVVYIDPDGALNWDISNNLSSEKTSEAILKCNSLMNLASLIKDKKKKDLAYRQLGAGLGYCLRSEDQNTDYDLDRAFASAALFIESAQISSMKIKFLMTILFISTILTAALATLHSYFPDYSLQLSCIFSALVGSFVSVLQRSNSLPIDPFSSQTSLVVESTSRILVGVCFGAFIIFLSKSELALAPFKEQFYALAVFSFISGFSERFVPDLVTNISKESLKQ
ncbi:hypothetical protein AB4129_19060 [Vibrio cyclitrophicus]